MVLKTFNVGEDTYKRFSSFCKSRGISMSKQIDNFMNSLVAEEPNVREEYLERLEGIKKSHFIDVKDFGEKYKL